MTLGYLIKAYLSAKLGVRGEDWLYDINGYQVALRESKLRHRPVLLYLRRKACHKCIEFERDYLNGTQNQDLFDQFIKVQILTDTDRDHQQFTAQFKSETTPALFVFYDQNDPSSTYLILATDQIWVQQPNTKTGNFMYLSPISFRLALITAVSRAKQQWTDAHDLPSQSTN
jgi:hypothetical protein